MLFNKISVLFLALFIVACSSSENELAQQGDWHEIGFSDGIKGHHPRSFSSLQELGQANQSEYDQGYIEGVTDYCNPDFAYQIGLSGQYYEGVCEGTEEAQRFRMEWQRGWNEFN